MKVLSSHVEVRQEYPFLLVETDLGRMMIGHEQKLLAQYGLVFVGAEFEEVLPEIELPAEPENGQGALTLRGFTAEPAIVELVRAWRASADEEA